MLMVALNAEADGFVARFGDALLSDGRQRVVRHGIGPEREIQTGGRTAQGPAAEGARPRDGHAAGGEDQVDLSDIPPKWARRSKSLDALLPALYLRGVSTSDFQGGLAALLETDAPNLSPGAIARLAASRPEEYDRWRGRDLSARRNVYVWADGVYLQARMEPQAECIPVIIGATPEDGKELLGIQVEGRESAQSWRKSLVDIKACELAVAPEVPVGDGALGFWKAIDEVFPGSRHQRCWFHKISDFLNKVPKSIGPAVKSDLQESVMPKRRRRRWPPSRSSRKSTASSFALPSLA